MRNDGYSDIIDGVKAGDFYIKTEGGQEKSISLTPKKITTINYNGQHIKGWITHEDNMSPYPQEPLHNAEMYRKTLQKVSMNYADANEVKLLELKKFMEEIEKEMDEEEETEEDEEEKQDQEK